MEPNTNSQMLLKTVKEFTFKELGKKGRPAHIEIR